MNIGFFSPTINRVGGGELVALNMIHALKKKKHRIIIYSAEKIDNNHIKNFLGDQIRFDEEVTIGPKIFDPYSLQCIYPNLARSRLFRLKCDILIDTFSDAVFPWTDAIYFNQYPRVTKLPRDGLRGKFCAPYKLFLTNSAKHVESNKKKLLTCSRFMAEKIEKSTGLHVDVLYPPVSDFFKVGDSVFLKNNTVVSVFRISHGKRPETIPQIAKLSSGDFSFIIVGSCQTSDELSALKVLQDYIRKFEVDKKVKLLINVSREKQREVLQKAKVYLHPSLSNEAFGISVAEAMSAGCVPIAPDAGGLKEIVPDQLRYHSLEEAATLVDKAIEKWSPSQSEDSLKSVEKFSQSKFCENFIELMQL